MTEQNEKIEWLIRNLLIECHEDYIGLWAISKDIKDEGIATDPKQIQDITFEVIRSLLVQGMVAGNFHQKDPQVYDMPPQAIIDLIDEEWKKLGREPTIGEIISFTAPSFLPNIIHTK